MKYQIQSIQIRNTTTGKQVADVTLEGVTGTVTMWGSNWPLNTITAFSEVEGDLVPAKDARYGPTLFPARTERPMTGGRSGARGGAGVAAAQERKATMIQEAQGNKELGIKVSSTMRDAVQIALAEPGVMNDHENYATRILYWRKWLWEHWDDTSDYPPFA